MVMGTLVMEPNCINQIVDVSDSTNSIHVANLVSMELMVGILEAVGSTFEVCNIKRTDFKHC